MKMPSDHLVPLSLQAVAVLAQVKPITSRIALVFPLERNRQEPKNDNTMRRAIFKLGYDGTVPATSMSGGR